MTKKSARASPSSRNFNAKLSDEQVTELRRRRWEDFEPLKNLALDYGISIPTIQRIIAGQRYKDLPMYPQMPKYFKAYLPDGRRRELPND